MFCYVCLPRIWQVPVKSVGGSASHGFGKFLLNLWGAAPPTLGMFFVCFAKFSICCFFLFFHLNHPQDHHKYHQDHPNHPKLPSRPFKQTFYGITVFYLEVFLASWGALGPLWGHVGGLRAFSGPLLGLSWGHLGRLGAFKDVQKTVVSWYSAFLIYTIPIRCWHT